MSHHSVSSPRRAALIDIPADDEQEAITQYFGEQRLYSLTPVSEEVARPFARRSRSRPVHVCELVPTAEVGSIRHFEDGGDVDGHGDEGDSF